MEKYVSAAKAKAEFSECLRQVEAGNSLLITRHGKPVAAIVHPDDLDHIKKLRKAGPKSGLASIAGGWENSEELVKIIDASPRTGQRNVPDLDC